MLRILIRLWLAVHGSHPELFTAGLDKSDSRGGKPSAYLESKEQKVDGFATLMQNVRSDKYVGKRMQLSGYLKPQNATEGAALWMRIDGENGKLLGFDNMEKRQITGTADWKKYSVVLDVPETARAVAFGFMLSGPGKVLANKMHFEPVGEGSPYY